jgi:pyruvate dehydrogenase E2 component (dihydrolipoamide acetyltransferase)
MLHKITMPDAGQTTDQLVVARWLKQVGEAVGRGDVLLEVETDKATVTVESFGQGKLLKRLVQEGETVTAGDVIAWVGEEADLAAEKKPAAPAPAAAAPAPTSASAAPARPDGAAPAPSAVGPATSGRVRASPAARKAARDRAVDLGEIARACGKPVVKRADVLAFRPAASAAPAARSPLPKGPDPAPFELVKPSRTRQVIAARMVESATTIPAFTLEIEADMTRCMAVREELNAHAGEVRVAYHDIVARCVAVAAKKRPLVNASLREDGIHVYQSVNVGLAVAREEGLVVPVVRDVGQKALAAIARENAQNIAAARDGTLRPEALEGGTITVSNLGMYPVRKFTAIINPPQTCILALGAIAPRPAWVDGAWAARPTLAVTGSFDHRVLDGAYAAEFLKDLQELLETPTMLLL